MTIEERMEANANLTFWRVRPFTCQFLRREI